MRALFVVNPQATTTTPRARDVITGALAHVVDLDVAHTEYRGHGIELASEAATKGYELVISLGGDGTVNEVVNGLLATPSGLSRPSFAALPGGSANVFIRALGLSGNPVEAAGTVLEALREGRQRTIGLGRINSEHDDRYFTFCAGFGWDAAVVHEVERLRRNGRRASPALYAAVAVRLFLRGDVRDSSLRVEAPGRAPARDLYLALVTNTTPWTYAGSVPVQPTPNSDFHLGLDGFALTQLHPTMTLRLVLRMLSRRGVPPRGRGYVSWHDQESMTIHSDHPRAFQIDGEYLGHREQVNFHSIPKALRIIG
ncbi:diacylglycerol/lipid kinase family protein [Halostreptopolyspora alba]|uniref:Diacylglycerol kinase family lipid kinase n=1 Tax=Halostreptopolyspora alba TaxID=2487137 RepID=A0A3N0ECN2_9ACTN|nr:diacylglycerol kinase family lipid kinase [Nocardiopsaceae bacterium YIM 96095]